MGRDGTGKVSYSAKASERKGHAQGVNWWSCSKGTRARSVQIRHELFPPPSSFLFSLLFSSLFVHFFNIQQKNKTHSRTPQLSFSVCCLNDCVCVCVLRWDLTASEVHSQLARDTMPIHVRDSNIKTCIPPFLSLSLSLKEAEEGSTHSSFVQRTMILSFFPVQFNLSISKQFAWWCANLFFYIYLFWTHTHTHE